MELARLPQERPVRLRCVCVAGGHATTLLYVPKYILSGALCQGGQQQGSARVL